MIETRQTDQGLILKVHIQPRASKNEVVGEYKGALKIRITAPPVDHQANRALIAFLAELLGIRKSQIEILSGHTGRNKTVIFYSCNKELITLLLT
ncbi:MAG TPA: DUF167 domain-containing protein [Candidatus Limnocylindrales bacterium]|nr:DUF167 domain-containing protein [Candidatus Limnocylindrales bacterium]